MAKGRPEILRPLWRSSGPLRTLLLCLGLLLAGALSCGAATAGDGWWSGLDDGEAVSLADVKRAPRSYRGRTLTFFCIFHGVEKNFDPFRTPFSPKFFDNFTVWPDGTPVWEKKAFIADLPFLYIRRNHQQRDALLRTAKYTRIEVTGAIREVLRGSPTIEVFSFRPTGHRLGLDVVREVMRGHNHARLGTENGYELAARNFKRALTPDLPPLYVMHVRKLLGDSLRKTGHGAEADAYERGQTYGTSELPAPDPKALAPEGAPPEPGLEPGMLPPAGRGRASPRPPVLPDSELPGTRLAPDAGPAPGLPVPFPSARTPLDDLPGRPVGPRTPDDQLPGSPGSAPPPAPPLGRAPASAPSDVPGGFPPPALPERRRGSAPAAVDWGQPPANAAATPRRPSTPAYVPPAPGRTSAPTSAAPTPAVSGPFAPEPRRPSAQAYVPSAGTPPAATSPAPAPARRRPGSGIPPTRKPRISGVR